MKTHPNAKLTCAGRRLLVWRIEDQGWGAPEAADAAGVSLRTAYNWLARYRAESAAELHDRGLATPCFSFSMPASTRPRIEQRRRRRKTAWEIAQELELAARRGAPEGLTGRPILGRRAKTQLRCPIKPKWVSQVLGPHSVAFTLEVYAHVLDHDSTRLDFLPAAATTSPPATTSRKLRSL